MKKKFLLTVLLIALGTLVFGAISASAYTEEIYTYTVSSGKATITDCDTSASGNITIPDTLGGYTVTRIGDNAFHNCRGLRSVTIPDGVTSIGKGVFAYCYGLTSITIPDSVTSIGDYAFHSCDRLTSITIPDNVTSIGECVFYFCRGLISITIPDSITSIGNDAFLGCDGLTSISIPDGVTSIGDYAFAYCYGLTSISIPDGVTSIGKGVFAYCYGLTTAIIPDSITNIGDDAFSGCDGLTSITIPDSVTSIGDFAFSGCSGLTTVIIPDSVTSIGDYAFSYCYGLTSISIPDSITSIGNDAFNGCDGLAGVNITDIASWCNIKFEDIDSNPLYYASNLYLNGRLVTNLEIPDSITSIGDYAFSYCYGLTSISIPDSVTSIGNDAFYNCPNIETVFYAGNETEWNEISFDSGNENLTNTNIFYDAAWTDRTGKTFDDALIAEENKQYTVTIAESGQMIYYEFVPKYTGVYRFYSTGGTDTYAYLYNGDKSQITSNDNGENGSNFYIERELTAGNTYYIATNLYSGTGTFTLHIETDCVPGTKTVCITASDGRMIFKTVPSYIPLESKIILACYDNGRFVEMESAPNQNETIYFIADEYFDFAKIMVWDSFETMMPLCEVEIVQ